MLKKVALLIFLLPLILFSCKKADRAHHHGIREWSKLTASDRSELQVYTVARVLIDNEANESQEKHFTISTGYLEETDRGQIINGGEDVLKEGFVVYPGAYKAANIDEAIEKVDDILGLN